MYINFTHTCPVASATLLFLKRSKNYGIPPTKRRIDNCPLILILDCSPCSLDWIRPWNYFDFLLFEHRCTKNQSLQVFGRIEQEFNGSETLQVSPPKFIFRGRNFVGCLKIPPLWKINFVKFRCYSQFFLGHFFSWHYSQLRFENNRPRKNFA